MVCQQEDLASKASLAVFSVPLEGMSVPAIVFSAAMPSSAVEAVVVTTNADLATRDSTEEMTIGKEVEVSQKEALSLLGVDADNGYDNAISAARKAHQALVNDVEIQTLTSFNEHVDEYIHSPQTSQIIKLLLSKYGDITVGSLLKSMAGKFAILELVADVVNRLCNNTMETLNSHELQIIEAQTTDAAAVGFNVEWLQQRVDEVIAASKYHAYQTELDELGNQIESTRKCLMEMEQRQMALACEVVAIKARLRGNDLVQSCLGEGLLFSDIDKL